MRVSSFKIVLFLQILFLIKTYSQSIIKDAQNQFVFKLWSKAKVDTSNFFVSPLSIHAALSILNEGAKGKTRQEISQVLGFKKEQYGQDYIKSLSSLTPEGDSFFMRNVEHEKEMYPFFQLKTSFNIGNSLWRKNSNDWNKEYFNQAKVFYGADIFDINPNDLDYSNMKANEWVSSKTNGKITSLPSPFTAETELTLLNTTYFNATWATIFDENATKKRKFHSINKAKIDIDFMKSRNYKNYYEDDDLQAIKLPYELDMYSMIVILPQKRFGLNKVESSLNSIRLSEILSKMYSFEVILSLPKFKLQTTLNLNQTAQSLGIKDGFSDLADFSVITSAPKLRIGNILHQTYIDINEKKTEATALSLIEIRVAGYAGTNYTPPPPLKVFNANHPFLFLIVHEKTQTIMFMGRYVKPM